MEKLEREAADMPEMDSRTEFSMYMYFDVEKASVDMYICISWRSSAQTPSMIHLFMV